MFNTVFIACMLLPGILPWRVVWDSPPFLITTLASINPCNLCCYQSINIQKHVYALILTSK
jgi:hypothetical protein